MRVLILTSLIFLVACSGSSDIVDLEEFVASTAEKPRGRIPALPEFKPYSAFIYSASAMRSPFKSPAVFEELIQQKADSVAAPDLNRPKDPLERFALGEVVLVGTIAKENSSELKALLKTASGSVYVAERGHYVGKNNGKIIHVDEAKVDILETVPDGSGGWIARPQSLGFAGSGGN